MNQSQNSFFKKPTVKLAVLVITTILEVGTPLAIVLHRQNNCFRDTSHQGHQPQKILQLSILPQKVSWS